MARRLLRTSTRTPDGTTNLVVASRELTRDGTAWVEARLATLPNGRLGWVPRSALGGWEFVDTRVAVDRARLSLTPYRDGAVVFRAPVGIGKPSTPTPDWPVLRARPADRLPQPQLRSARVRYQRPVAIRHGLASRRLHRDPRTRPPRPHPGPDLARSIRLKNAADSEIGQTDASRDPRYGSVTGRKRDWRKLVGALLVGSS